VTVILNEVGIKRLMASLPVMEYVQRTVESRLVEPVQQDIVDYFHRAPSLTVEGDVDTEIRGDVVVMGIRDTHPESEDSKGRRLVRTGLYQKWLQEARNAAGI
jgi:hypothetical protein